ncbi:MAG: TlpA family protein disulfide reductase [Pyrinomonadaceae bacterium]|nr:TlpA family protein disulfide reductase [Pyrinomonadaceae bacterium]
MRVFAKICLLFILLVAVAGIFSACNYAGAPRTESNQSNIPKSDYPPAPPKLMEATLTKTDGTTFTLNSQKGKVILINAWATWCGPCRQEMPELIKMQTELKDKGLEIIGLAVDEQDDNEAIKSFAKEMGINYDLVKGDESLFGEFLKISKKDAIPQSFLIDRDGKLVGVFVGGGSTLQRLLDGTRKLVNS